MKIDDVSRIKKNLVFLIKILIACLLRVVAEKNQIILSLDNLQAQKSG